MAWGGGRPKKFFCYFFQMFCATFLGFCERLCCGPNLAHGKKAHDKGPLCRPNAAVCPLPWAAHGKSFAVGKTAFAVCFGHTVRSRNPVVLEGDDAGCRPIAMNLIDLL